MPGESIEVCRKRGILKNKIIIALKSSSTKREKPGTEVPGEPAK